MPEANSTQSGLSNQKQPSAPVGPTVGIVIIVFLLLAGAVYFFIDQLNKPDPNPPSFIPGDQTT
jgi:hypothetical protein